MINKYLTMLFALTLMSFMFSSNPALAQNCFNFYGLDKTNYLINLTDRMESQTENAVKTDRIVNLVINNRSKDMFNFTIPMMNIEIEVPGKTVAVIPVKFSNQNDKDTWFTVRNIALNTTKPSFELSYQPNLDPRRLESESNNVDNKELFNISYYNWSEISNKNNEVCTNYKSYDISDNPPLTPPPKAVQKIEPASSYIIKTGGYIRAYW